jgi:2-polyprenyl-3-methyl-5-hydroxy-6-metoxy-1,4-benzoquinol methylase
MAGDPVLDVSEIMEGVRERARRKRAEGRYGEDPAAVSLEVEAASSDRSAPVLVVGHRETLASRRRVVGPFITFVRRAVVKTISPFLADLVNQINAFHVEASSRIGTLESRIGMLESETRAAAEQLGMLAGELDAIETRAGSLERRLGPLATPAPLQVENDGGEPTIGYRGNGEPAGERLYIEFQNIFRESEDVIRARQRFYVEILSGRAPVLDVGCGRGELLDLLAEANVTASGIDVDRAMVAHCREKGHRVDLAEAVAYLEIQSASSFGAIFSAHVIEHLEYDHLLRFLSVAREKLRPGGLFVAETPNPHSIIAFRSFWLDVTHRAPIYPEVAAVLCGLEGFENVQVLFPNGSGDLHADRSECGDYTVIASKASET